MRGPRPFLIKRSNGVWCVVATRKGHRIWRSTRRTRKREALKALRHIKIRPKSPPEPDPKTLAAFLKDFLEYLHVNHQKKTIEMYERTGRHFQAMVGAEKCLKDMNAKTWDDYTVFRSPHISRVSILNEQRMLKAMMNKAVEWDYVTMSPFARVKKINIIEMPPKYFTRGEFERLIGLIEEPWLKDAVLFSIATGIRQGELVNLRWEDVDLARRVIVLQSSYTFRIKGNRPRAVPLSSLALDVIERQEKHPACPYVFHSKWKKLNGNWVSGLFRHYVKEAGLYERKLHWHNLRASFASWLVSSGVPLFAVSKLLGHSTAVLTQRHYGPWWTLDNIRRRAERQLSR